MQATKNLFTGVIILLITGLIFSACTETSNKKIMGYVEYNKLKDSIQANNIDTSGDSHNIFDMDEFIPGVDSLDTMLVRLDSLWQIDAIRLANPDSTVKPDSIDKVVIDIVSANKKSLDSFFVNKNKLSQNDCTEKECPVYAEVIKSKQMMYLYIEGQLFDSFLVSTGKGKYETPELSLKPMGPVFIKYTSRKFPGGNYMGLGNMPYAVFVKGGYAIHGTTKGNFSKLGSKASHGCIRLHPDNAKIFNELVKRAGLDNTWISIKDSLPVINP